MRLSLLRHLLCLLTGTVLLSGCYYSQPHRTLQLTESQLQDIDSATFRAAHHYWEGYNLLATDTLRLRLLPPGSQNTYEMGLASDTDALLLADDRLVVADIRYLPSDSVDSVWVKVARDQFTQGWTREKDLLRSTVPDDPISQFISWFSDSRLLFLLTAVGLALLFLLVQANRHRRPPIVHFNDINSFYPTLLCLCVSGAATLYGTLQRFAPDVWVEYYFHPTLNPFQPGLPLIMTLFLGGVWLIVIAGIALIDDLRHQPDTTDKLTYLTTLAGVAMVLYLFFSLTVHFFIGYPLLLLYWAFALWKNKKRAKVVYICGKCRRPIAHGGVCPHCGAYNKI